jgi:exonuclease III
MASQLSRGIIKRMKNTFFIFLLLLVFSCKGGSETQTNSNNSKDPLDDGKLIVSSFNINWFGLNGNQNGSLGTETRISFLKNFIEQNLSSSDIIIFQEIVDKNLFMNNLMKEFRCISYEDTLNINHQFIVACILNKNYDFVKISGESDYIAESVAVSSDLRPALVFGVRDKVSSNVLFNIMGVHLKNGLTYGPTRLDQVNEVLNFINASLDENSFLIMGDFNTENPTPPIDEDLIDDLFMNNSLKSFSPLVPKSLYTYRNSNYFERYDLAYIESSDESKVSGVSVFSMCTNPQTATYDFFDRIYYNSHISDHCPITVSVDLP